MAAIEASLFTWQDVDAHSDLERFYLVRDHLPDEQLVQYCYVPISLRRSVPTYPG